MLTKRPDKVAQAFGQLLTQLSRSAPALEAATLGAVAHVPANGLLVAHVDSDTVPTLMRSQRRPFGRSACRYPVHRRARPTR
jgi:hypothetical protein